jgi:DNA-binding transcriptional regulator YiaG
MASKDRPGVKVRARAKRLEKEEGLSPLIAEACAGIDELVETDVAGEPATGLYTIRTRKLDLRPRDYGPADVRAARLKLKASQALLAKVIGVNTQTVSYWEQGRRKVPSMARRYLDDLIDFPAIWAARTGAAVEAK